VEICSFRTRTGRDLTLCPFVEGALQQLLAFYDQFEPKGVDLGIPPRVASTRREWVGRLARTSVGVLAMDGDRVVGHTAAVPINASTSELFVFVHQDAQNQGIGTELVRSLAKCAAEIGLKRLWLSVLNSNFIAIHVYRKCGFRFVGPMDVEREMVLDIG
jgi:RimJ/RimL family protein N-acetyltransferase